MRPDARVERVYAATARYLQQLDPLTADDLTVATVLPDWTRAHVVAHLALHALGTSRALTGLAHGHPLPIYDSEEARDRDIEATAALPVDELRELSCEAIHESDATWDGLIERTPRGQMLAAEDVLDTRWRELEIHHVDLGIGYSPADWPAEFTAYIFDLVVHDRSSEDLTLRLPGGDLVLGDGGPAVAGDAASIAYWLLGRDSGHGLSDHLPTLGPWRRRTPVR
jgi:maleylpyruvate isomerase